MPLRNFFHFVARRDVRAAPTQIRVPFSQTVTLRSPCAHSAVVIARSLANDAPASSSSTPSSSSSSRISLPGRAAAEHRLQHPISTACASDIRTFWRDSSGMNARETLHPWWCVARATHHGRLLCQGIVDHSQQTASRRAVVLGNPPAQHNVVRIRAVSRRASAQRRRRTATAISH